MVLPTIKELLEPWEWIIPSWCDRVVVHYDADLNPDEDGDAAMSCSTQYRYRLAVITFYPPFITQSNPVQNTLHELCHIPIDIMAGWIEERIDQLVPVADQPLLNKTLQAELLERVESATQDLSSRIAAEWGKMRVIQ